MSMDDLFISVRKVDIEQHFNRRTLTPRTIAQIHKSIGGERKHTNYAVYALAGEGLLHMYQNPFGDNYYHPRNDFRVIWSEDGDHTFQNPDFDDAGGGVELIIDPTDDDTVTIEPVDDEIRDDPISGKRLLIKQFLGKRWVTNDCLSLTLFSTQISWTLMVAITMMSDCTLSSLIGSFLGALIVVCIPAGMAFGLAFLRWQETQKKIEVRAGDDGQTEQSDMLNWSVMCFVVGGVAFLCLMALDTITACPL